MTATGTPASRSRTAPSVERRCGGTGSPGGRTTRGPRSALGRGLGRGVRRGLARGLARGLGRALARAHDDTGSAVVEFVGLGVLLLLPVVYLVVTLGRIQAASFATDGGARSASRAFVTATDDAHAAALATASARLALLDQGFAPGPADVQVECSARPCLTPQARIVVRVSVDVVLPLVPAALDAVIPTHVTVRSTQVATVDAFRPVAP